MTFGRLNIQMSKVVGGYWWLPGTRKLSSFWSFQCVDAQRNERLTQLLVADELHIRTAVPSVWPNRSCSATQPRQLLIGSCREASESFWIAESTPAARGCNGNIAGRRESADSWNFCEVTCPSKGVQKLPEPPKLPKDTATVTVLSCWCAAAVQLYRLYNFRSFRLLSSYRVRRSRSCRAAY